MSPDLPLTLLHGFGLAFLWSVLTCVLAAATVLVIDSIDVAITPTLSERIDRTLQRTFTVALCGIVVFGAGTLACGAWTVFGRVFA